MASFGTASRANLVDVNSTLVKIANGVVGFWDCSVTDGVRSIEEQRKNVARGVSKTMDSKHLPQPDKDPKENGKAKAIDIVPYPVNWTAIEKGYAAIKHVSGGMEVAEMYAFAGFVDGYAAALGINLRSGYDWNTNRQFEDQSFLDLPHHEMRG